MQNPVTTITQKITQRPAESTTAAGAFAVLVARLLGLTDVDAIVALTCILGLVPGFVTWLVETLRTWRAKS